MPKVSVYLPDDLYASARSRELPLSTLLQRAVEAELRRDATTAWVERVRRRPRRHVADFDRTALMDDVREEFGA